MLKNLFLIVCAIPLLAFGQKRKQSFVLNNHLNEISSLESLNDSTLLAVNDSGNKAEIIVLKTNGDIQRTIPVVGVENQDWEGISLSEDKQHLFIGDFGNNLLNRKNQLIYSINIENLEQKETLRLDSTITLRDNIVQQKDWEAMLIAQSHLLFSKEKDSTLIVYLSKDHGVVIHEKTLNLPGRSYWKTAITDACVFDDKYYLLTYKRVLVYTSNWDLERKIKLGRIRQFEALCATNLGIFVACERNRILGKAKLFFIPW